MKHLVIDLYNPLGFHFSLQNLKWHTVILKIPILKLETTNVKG